MRLPNFLRARLLGLARRIMNSRPPDRVIGGRYLSRWHVIPRNRFFNIYLHKTLTSDRGRGVHDHPWASVSLHLEGERLEVTPGCVFLRQPGDVVFRRAKAQHKLFQRNGEPVVTLFLTARRTRRWFFYAPDGGKESGSALSHQEETTRA